MTKKTPIQLRFDPNRPEGKLKSLGGGKADEWNNRLSNLTINALPIAHSKTKMPLPRHVWLSLTV